jgi:hypothetical protein
MEMKTITQKIKQSVSQGVVWLGTFHPNYLNN